MSEEINAYTIARAIDNEDLETIKEYYKQKSDIFLDFSFSGAQENALHYAAYHGKFNVCKCLTQLGMDVNSETVRWNTPLCRAASKGYYNLAEYFLDIGANINGNTNTIATPLMSAITFKHEQVAQLLIERGADINRIHLMTHQTSLELSRIWKCTEIQKLLIEKGGKGRMTESDINHSAGSGILFHISKIGFILPVELGDDKDISIGMAIINNKKQKMLFTHGLYAYTVPKIEFNIILRSNGIYTTTRCKTVSLSIYCTV